MLNTLRTLALCAACLLAAAAPAHAAALSYSGSFAKDNDVRLFSFAMLATGTVTIETFGYAGGTDAAGTAVASGGFDPVFALFGPGGALIAYGDDGATRPDPINGNAFDALLVQTLGPGTYLVALSQFDNYALGPTVAAGYLEDANPNFTLIYGCNAGRFCDLTGGSRTPDFDLSISGLQVVAVPEPSRPVLLAAGIASLLFMRRRRCQNAGPSSSATLAAAWRRRWVRANARHSQSVQPTQQQPHWSPA